MHAEPEHEGQFMRLYFFRHAEAQPHEITLPDAERRLTNRGIMRTHHAAKYLRAVDVDITRLYSSPLVRARQTADILGQAFSVAVQVRDELNFGFDAARVDLLIRDLGRSDHVMFVGHEPDFSSVVQELTGAECEIKRGGMARVDIVDYQPLRGRLMWLLTPKLFDVLS
jgi:phosphohistidine phosphatase